MKKIKTKDILQYRFPSNLQMSPDGKHTAFEVSYADEKKNCYHKDVWMIKGGKAKQFTFGSDTSIVMWKDDSHLIVSRNNNSEEFGYTLYSMDVTGGEPLPWIKLPLPVESIRKISNSKLVFIATIDVKDPDAYLNNAEEIEKKKPKEKEEKDYTVVDEVPYWLNGAGFTSGKRRALFLYDLKNGKTKRLTDPYFQCVSFLINGPEVIYYGTAFRSVNPLTDGLYSYNVNGGVQKTLFTDQILSIREVYLKGKDLIVNATDMKEYGVNETGAFYKYEAGTLTKLFKPEETLYGSLCTDVMLSGGRSFKTVKDTLYTIATVEDKTVLLSFDQNMRMDTVYSGSLFPSFFDTDGKKILFCAGSAETLYEIYSMDMNGKRIHKITSLNDEFLAGKYIAKPQRIDYTSEGIDLHGWVLLPEKYSNKKKYPAILDVHGGPRTVYGEIFFHEMQVWTAKGYVVFFTNIKGSDGRGDAFADIRDDYGNTDFRNLMDFTDTVLMKYPNIDPARVYETGGSYGGFMTNWIITHTDRFCACASQRSISNWISFSVISDIGTDFGPDQCGAKGFYDDADIQKLWDHSPLKYAKDCVTPTLFIHSDEDYRCPLAEGMQMMQALRYNGVDTRLCIFHGENHELSRSGKPLHRIRRLKEITNWFDNHIGK